MKQIICPNCHSVNIEEYLQTQDHFLTKESFEIHRCLTCAILFTYPIPDQEILYDKYYKSENYLSHNKKSGDLFSIAYRLAQKINIRSKRNTIERLSIESKILLEIGSGTGDFLKSCQEHSWNVTGVEPSADARKVALEFNGLNLLPSLEDVTEMNFSVIALWHVLEHIPNLNETIIKLSSMLGEDGYLVIAVPNHNSLDAKYYEHYWAGYDVPRHLFHFSKNTIASILAQHGFDKIKIRPMLFDSFYVSLLSEKYKRGEAWYNKLIINNLIGVLIGIISNISAWFTGEYSSLIFIYRKK